MLLRFILSIAQLVLSIGWLVGTYFNLKRHWLNHLVILANINLAFLQLFHYFRLVMSLLFPFSFIAVNYHLNISLENKIGIKYTKTFNIKHKQVKIPDSSSLHNELKTSTYNHIIFLMPILSFTSSFF